jgi:hypothetical protein
LALALAWESLLRWASASERRWLRELQYAYESALGLVL